MEEGQRLYQYQDIAEDLRKGGWSPIPVRGKIPVLREWQQYNSRLPDDAELAKMIAACGRCGVGLAIGPWTVVIDIDVMDGGVASEVRALADGILGETPLVRQGRAPKVAMFYKCPAGEPVKPTRLKGLDIYCGSGQVVAYGIHPDTKQPYQWLPSRNRDRTTESDARGEFTVEYTPLNIRPTDQLLPTVTQDLVDTFVDEVVSRKLAGSRSPQGKSTRLDELRARRAIAVGDRDVIAWDQGVLGLAFKYAGLLRSRPHREGNRIGVVCPWTSEHGSGAGANTSTIVWGPYQRSGRGRWFCAHSSCLEKEPWERDAGRWLWKNYPEAMARAYHALGVYSDEVLGVMLAADTPLPTEEACLSVMLADEEDRVRGMDAVEEGW